MPGDDAKRPSGGPGSVTLGLLPRQHEGFDVVPIETCWLQDDTANAILRAVRAAAQAAVLPSCALHVPHQRTNGLLGYEASIPCSVLFLQS